MLCSLFASLGITRLSWIRVWVFHGNADAETHRGHKPAHPPALSATPAPRSGKNLTRCLVLVTLVEKPLPLGRSEGRGEVGVLRAPGRYPREELEGGLEGGSRAEESLGRMFREKTIVSEGVEKVAFVLGEEENRAARGLTLMEVGDFVNILGILNKPPLIPSLVPLLLEY